MIRNFYQMEVALPFKANKTTGPETRNVAGLEYIFERKKVKNINIRIKRDASVCVSAPKTCKISDVEKFILLKKQWIEKAQIRVRNNYEHQNAPCTVTKQEALEMFNEVSDKIFPLFYKTLNGQKPLIKVRDMKTRWGVCKVQARQITLNLRLTQKPKEALEYVVLHEYVHFLVHGHGKKFWDTLSIYMPDYKWRRALLK